MPVCVQRVSLELISCLSRSVSVCCTVCLWYNDANYELFLLRTLVEVNQYATHVCTFTMQINSYHHCEAQDVTPGRGLVH